MLLDAKTLTDHALQRFMYRVGVTVVLSQALDALTSALYVICSTETEAAELHRRTIEEKRGPRLIEYWRARREAAWSIRRHAAHNLEPAIRLLWKLVPAKSPADKSGRKDLLKKLRQAKSLGRPPPAQEER